MRTFIILIVLFCGYYSKVFASCNQLVLKAEVQKNNHTYTQIGAGTLFLENPILKNPFYIITPTHVVLGATQVWAYCEQHKYPVKIIASSTTADLTLAQIEDSENFTPAFYIQATNNTEDMNLSTTGFSAEIRIPTLQNQNVLQKIPVFSIKRYADSYLNPIFTQRGSLLISSGVIPGMSGSGVFLNQTFVGMITKSLINDSLSAAISIEDIKELFSNLKNGLDPFLDKPVHAEAALKWNESLKNWQRFYKLILHNDTINVALEDVCHAGVFAETSQWLSSGGWGEGGGEFLTTSTTTNPSFLLIQGEAQSSQLEKSIGIASKPAALFLQLHSPCSQEGVWVQNGSSTKRLLGLLNYPDENNQIHTLKISSVDAIIPLAQKLGVERLMDLIEKNGFFENKDEYPISILCQSNAFKKGEDLYDNDLEILDIKTNGSKHQFNRSLFFSQHLGTQSEVGPEQIHAKLFECNSEKDPAAIHIHSLPTNKTIQAHLRISADDLNGTLQIGSCYLNLDERENTNLKIQKDFWHGEIKSHDFDINIDMGIDLRNVGFIQMTASRVSPSCWLHSEFDPLTTFWRSIRWQAD